MSERYKVIIVGGGTAGWLTAAILGAEFSGRDSAVGITLIESANTPPIGVGEGTWPSMRSTLKKIGLSETDFIRRCNATLKQGTHFVDWIRGDGDRYYHPFSLPTAYADTNLADQWLAGLCGDVDFAQCVSSQAAICDAGKAPKQLGVPEYAYVLNYGYHLDAGEFAGLLADHAKARFNIEHLVDDVTGVELAPTGAIEAIETAEHGRVTGYLFVDCTGLRSLLLGDALNIPVISRKSTLFNDRALAVQVPYPAADTPIATTTRSTAREAGWIWDIGLQHRRGVGYVHSSAHTSSDQAEAVLRQYLNDTQQGVDQGALSVREIRFDPGHRQVFWQHNCVAIGLSAGFIEPLEASALVLVELSARALADRFPRTHEEMSIVAKRFNEEFLGHWQQIIDFLKLHYVLSRREDSDYWIDNRQESAIPQTLRDNLTLWQSRSPWHIDEQRRAEMFPSGSYQYVLYGMGFKTRTNPLGRQNRFDAAQVKSLLDQTNKARQRYLQHLPDHRALINQVLQQGFARV